jgi:hypothetical protein
MCQGWLISRNALYKANETSSAAVDLFSSFKSLAVAVVAVVAALEYLA